MEYILSALLILGFIITTYLQRYFFKKLNSKALDNKEISDKISAYHNIQSQNTVKLTNLLQKIFVTTSDEKIPNEVTKNNTQEIEFSEQNMFTLPKDLKFEIEGGDSNLPLGFMEKK